MNQSKKTNVGHVGLVKHLQTSLSGIEMKARNNKDHKFENLYGLLNKWKLQQSWKYVNKRASSGVDKIKAREFGKKLLAKSIGLETELKNNAYKANLIRRTHIEKSGGKLRPLGIPTVRDKLLQTLCSKILEAIYKPKFSPNRYGYRKNRGAKETMKHLGKELNFGKYGYVVEADIRGYFDNINHEKLLKMLAENISNKRFLNLIKKWLKVGILKEDGIVERKDQGIPQRRSNK